jgi:hypothetical protein
MEVITQKHIGGVACSDAAFNGGCGSTDATMASHPSYETPRMPAFPVVATFLPASQRIVRIGTFIDGRWIGFVIHRLVHHCASAFELAADV